jgi:hypothetical protein
MNMNGIINWIKGVVSRFKKHKLLIKEGIFLVLVAVIWFSLYSPYSDDFIKDVMVSILSSGLTLLLTAQFQIFTQSEEDKQTTNQIAMLHEGQQKMLLELERIKSHPEIKVIDENQKTPD